MQTPALNTYDTLRAVRTLGNASLPSIRCALCDVPLSPDNASDTCADCYAITTDSIQEGNE